MPLKGDVTKESIEELLKAEKLPAVIEFTDKNSQKIFSAGIERQVRAPLGVSAYWVLWGAQGLVGKGVKARSGDSDVGVALA